MIIGIDIRNIGKKRTGDETVFFHYVKNLALIDSENEYFLFTDVSDEKVLGEIKNKLGIVGKNNFQIISLKSANRFAWNLWTLPRYLSRHPVDVYHTQYITPFFVSRKIKIVTTVHDISFNFYPQYIRWSDLFFLKILIPTSLRRADKIVAVSEFTRSEIIRYYRPDPDKVVCAYNALGDDFMNRNFTSDQIQVVKNKYNLPEKFILYVGTMQPRKNIPLLIKAFSKMRSKIPDAKLVLAGNKDAHNFDKGISDAVRENNLEPSVIFPGYIDQNDMAALQCAAHVFVFPSLYEGFGIPVLEAMSQSAPVLASGIPSLSEIAGDGALLFNPQSLDDLENKLYTIYTDENLRRRLIEAGLARVRFFSWQKTAQSLLQIYRSLVK